LTERNYILNLKLQVITKGAAKKEFSERWPHLAGLLGEVW